MDLRTAFEESTSEMSAYEMPCATKESASGANMAKPKDGQLRVE
jgi:hypothetical protein